MGGATVSLADSGSDFRCRLILAISSGAKTNLPRFIIPRIFCNWTSAFNSASGIPNSTETSCKVLRASGMSAFLQRRPIAFSDHFRSLPCSPPVSQALHRVSGPRSDGLAGVEPRTTSGP